MAIREVGENEIPFEFMINRSPFWIRVYNLPFNYHTISIAQMIENNMAGLIKYKERKNKGWKKFLCFKVVINLDAPL